MCHFWFNWYVQEYNIIERGRVSYSLSCVTAVVWVHYLLLQVVYVWNVTACIRWYGKRSWTHTTAVTLGIQSRTLSLFIICYIYTLGMFEWNWNNYVKLVRCIIYAISSYNWAKSGTIVTHFPIGWPITCINWAKKGKIITHFPIGWIVPLGQRNQTEWLGHQNPTVPLLEWRSRC
jgi:hypothetical protein